MSLLERVTTLVRANVNDLLDRAEDPEKMLKQILLDMHSEFTKAKSQVAEAMADQYQLEAKWRENQDAADKWDQKAQVAVRKGEDALAKEALARRNSYRSVADGFKGQYDEQKKQVDALKTELDKLEAKITDTERNKDLLIARSRRARAQTKIQGTMAGIENVGTFDALKRMEDKIGREEARAKAATDLAGDTVEEQFAAMEEESDVDRDLAAMKKKLGMTEAPEPTETKKTRGGRAKAGVS